MSDLASQLVERARSEGGPTFMGKPDRWWDGGRWRCESEHVSTMLLKTERGRVCVACRGPVWLTHPADVDGPLS